MASKREQPGNLQSARMSVRLLDATLRDGGLVNDFRFTDDFAKALYTANLASGVDYMEFGYKASRSLFPAEKFGKWKFCSESDIRDVVGDNDTDMKISVMSDVGRVNLESEVVPKSDSGQDGISMGSAADVARAILYLLCDAPPVMNGQSIDLFTTV